MSGPIDFLSDDNTRDTKPPTQYGGEAGPIQPPPHAPTPDEERGLIVRSDPTVDLDELPG
jgi:hypothetical protein